MGIVTSPELIVCACATGSRELEIEMSRQNSRNEVTSLVRNAKDKYNNDLIKKNYKHEFFLQKLVEHS
jgi:hypothetical protein